MNCSMRARSFGWTQLSGIYTELARFGDGGVTSISMAVGSRMFVARVMIMSHSCDVTAPGG